MIDASEFQPMAQIEADAGGTFQFSELDTGIYAKLLPCYDRFDNVVDLVAWPAKASSPWWLRYGAATHLGDRALWQAAFDNRPVLLVGSPQDYLDHCGRCVCLLNWKTDPRDIFMEAGEIVCATTALRDRLETRISELARPRFRIRLARRAA